MVSLGSLNLATAVFVDFNHYDIDTLVDMKNTPSGASGLVLIAKNGDDYYKVRGTFLFGSVSSVSVSVNSVEEVDIDSDCDITTEAVTGVILTVPCSAVLAVSTFSADVEKYERDYAAFEALIF